MKLISQGAEAKIYLDEDKIIKKRVKKNYRLEILDNKLRKFRTRREAKVLSKLPKEFYVPELIRSADKSMEIEMEYIIGQKIRDVLDDNINLAKDIGKKIAIMHNSEIIHGDLTTSNMILKCKKVYFIDFGLSFFSEKVEDMAVDLFLFKKALMSKHHVVFEKAYEMALKSYIKHKENYKYVLLRLEKVEKRGRHINKKK